MIFTQKSELSIGTWSCILASLGPSSARRLRLRLLVLGRQSQAENALHLPGGAHDLVEVEAVDRQVVLDEVREVSLRAWLDIVAPADDVGDRLGLKLED